MSDTLDVLDRTNSLIRRRRTFIAAKPAATPSTPQTASPIPEDEDIPTLTDVVSPEAAISEPRSERLDETQVTLLASEIAHAFGEQLAKSLPTLIEAALLQTGKELGSGVSTVMENALRDFLSRRRQLHLPLDEQAEDDHRQNRPPAS
ncbi:hypothetical protein [Propionivibrio dicarboxylicus]|uniref:Uncharacterized protein n=1 Tax=Propionivibrio dicarboxylicus TaxID=83767 RepID=A0A1G7ZTD7_9RHOO|nr:hypothetical protein [Propionivibrio dicarboxylicus]SDH11921.1 hypothetical protein SAMN05660652_01274 [Propionivibrio dicarboxylicus]